LKVAEIVVVGGGPAGLSAALQASRYVKSLILIDEGPSLGGQLVKQTHKFFGSKEQYAGLRGIEIGKILTESVMRSSDIRVLSESTVIGYYENGVLGVLIKNREILRIKAERIIFATGASEKMLAFVNNDLPGVYGAGAVQTLMNQHGVIPGEQGIMVGAGNIGLIVTYQLAQAGVIINALVEALPRIGGYWVHASKIRRLGVPIYTSHTILKAYGMGCVEGAEISRLDERSKPVGRAKRIGADFICLAAGLSPLTELFWQAGCEMKFIAELGGYVPLRNEDLETSVKEIYVAGDSAGIEEASSAMIEGRLAGLNAAISLGYESSDYMELRSKFIDQLEILRDNEQSANIRKGYKKALLSQRRSRN
jgi:sarcosine oxidase subunit alpha